MHERHWHSNQGTKKTPQLDCSKAGYYGGNRHGFLSKLETGKAAGNWDTYLKLAGAMGITIDKLLVGGSNVQDAAIGYRRIPVLDRVQTGRFTGVNSGFSDEEMRDTIMTHLEHPPSTFAMRISGNSMEPEFKEGDLVVINPTLEPRPGEFVVAQDEGGEATFKQYRSAGMNEKGVDVFELCPLNPLYGSMRSDRQHIAFVGVIVEHRRYRRR